MSCEFALFSDLGQELRPNTLKPRPYQQEAFLAVRRELSQRRSTAVILPTGTGKTVLFALIARSCVEHGGRTLIIAHRKELIDQAASMIDRVGIMPGIERAELQARALFDPLVVVASKDSLYDKRISTWYRDHFRLIVCDEAHHATAPTYTRIFKHFNSAKLLGVTATPDRADEDEILNVFETVAYERTIWEMMTDPPPGPWLCRLKFVQCDVQIDLRGLRTTCGDFSADDLKARISPLVETLANALVQEIEQRPTIVFCPDVGSSMGVATALQSLGVKAEWVSGDDPNRDSKMKGYRDGHYQVLVNCNVATEGVDVPRTAAIGLLRPTKSRLLYSQMAGRGTRLKSGMKYEDCLLVDFSYLTNKHDLCRPVDLFDRTTKDDEENDIADEIVEQSVGNGQIDLIDVVQRAEREHKERQVLRIKAHQREIRYRRYAFDPLSASDALGIAMRQGHGVVHIPATQKQIDLLSKFKVADAGSISRRQASRLIDVIFERARKKLATPAQVNFMIALGMAPEEARRCTFKDASVRIGELKAGSHRLVSRNGRVG